MYVCLREMERGVNRSAVLGAASRTNFTNAAICVATCRASVMSGLRASGVELREGTRTSSPSSHRTTACVLFNFSLKRKKKKASSSLFVVSGNDALSVLHLSALKFAASLSDPRAQGVGMSGASVHVCTCGTHQMGMLGFVSAALPSVLC